MSVRQLKKYLSSSLILCPIVSVQPDIVIGTETWLSKDIKSSELFPDSYTVYRKDRDGTKGGGVLIAVKDNIKSSVVTELNSEAEILWVQLMTTHKRLLYICAYYRSHVSDSASLELFENSLRRALLARNPKVIIGGDFNLPDWDWKTNTLKKPASFPNLHHKFLDIIDDLGMAQIVEEPTREDNTLDLVVTNTPNLIPRLEIMPGLSDHDIAYFEYVTKLDYEERKPRPVKI